MRRLGVLVLVFTLAGCQAVRDAFSAHADEAARAGGETLSTERLAELVAHAKRIPINQGTVSSLAYVWVDYALFATALARNEPLTDSATVLAAAWPLVAQRKWEKFHDRLSAGRILLSGAQVDSAFAAGGARAFQHILVRVPANSGAEVEEQKRRQIEGLLRQIRARNGANFGQLARQHSDDPGSKGRGGYLGLSERSDPLVPEFKDAAWALAPGQISEVVRSAYGFHLIRRPPLGEVRDSFQAELESRLQLRFDSTYLDSLSRVRRVKMKDDAPAIARQAVQNLNAAWDDRRALVTYRGGAFRVSDLVRWLFAMDPQYVQGFASASDEQIQGFLELLAQRTILIWQADSAGVTLDPEDWDQIRAEHDSSLALLQSVLNLSPQVLADSAAGEEARVRFAMARIHDYLERVLSNRAQFAPVPPFLAAALRARSRWAVSAAGVAQAV
ncbi:MAG TPA: peptidylprolyl isomerase, partial [Gemmatimonadales bacterium]|nr:peptidylprolyl isomerase [Gemmatimonadales bacterium]